MAIARYRVPPSGEGLHAGEVHFHRSESVALGREEGATVGGRRLTPLVFGSDPPLG